MGKISINDLSVVLSERNGLNKKAASAFLSEMFNVVQEGLEQDRLVKIKGFGSFKIIEVDDRESVNVNTGERVLIEGHSKITFTPDALMKELVNKPFSQFETVVLKDGVDFDDVPEPVDEQEAPETPVYGTDSAYDEHIEAVTAPLVEFVADEDSTISNAESEVETSEEIVSEEFSIAKNCPEDEVSKDVVLEAEVSQIEKAEPEVEDSDESDDEVDESTVSGLKKWILPVLLLCCLCFAGGYYLGKNSVDTMQIVDAESVNVEDTVATEKISVQSPDTVRDATQKTQPEQKSAIESESASQQNAEPVVKTEPERPDAPKAEPMQKPAPQQVEKSTSETSVYSDKYEQMDNRVRTGAYRIVGTDHVEKIRPGDTLAKICKRTLGPGMECYLEVYNNIKSDADLTAGKEIKIPRLELKKKKAKITN